MKLIDKAAVLAASKRPCQKASPPGARCRERWWYRASPHPLGDQSQGTKHKTITFRGKTYELKLDGKMWLFQLKGHPEAGWTGCSPEFGEYRGNHGITLR